MESNTSQALNVHDYWHFYSGREVLCRGDIKLKVRRLSSMTEEEAREFLGVIMNFNKMFDNNWTWQYGAGFLVINPGQYEYNKQSYTVIKPFGPNNAPVFNCSHGVHEILWLIKKGFWLLGDNWFDQGLIIDEATFIED